MQLTPTEEQLMNHLWTREKAFLKELIDAYDEPKPAQTTVATLLKRMIDKKFVAYLTIGNSREYYPLVKKEDYFSKQVNGMIHDFFNNSPMQFASFFTRQGQLSEKELLELRQLIDQQITDRK
jgi:BlaI family penicillinase repressor